MDILNRYRENCNSSSSEDDSEDSDNECAVWKRATIKKTNVNEPSPTNGMDEEPLVLSNNENNEIEQSPQLLEPKPGQKRKRNTIWCDVLQDQLISEDFEDCLLKNKPRNYGNRGKESYDYTRAYNDDRRRDSESESGHSLNYDSGADSNHKLEKKHFFSSQKKSQKFVKLNSVELDAARKINKVLNEKKFYLIQRIVKFSGIDKAMHLLERTKEIEENGGMMIRSQSRRRTPGGVYIQMLKEDKEVTQEILDKIFEGEMSGLEMKKYYEEKRKNKKKKKKNFKHSAKGAAIESMEPDEIAPMEAEVLIDTTSSNTSVPSYASTSPCYTPTSVPSENLSDLEEGEIEE